MSINLFKFIQFLKREEISVILSILNSAKPGNEYNCSHSKNIFDIFVTGLICCNVISIILFTLASDNSKNGIRFTLCLYILFLN